MNVPGPAPCQCHSPASACTVSPTRIGSRPPPRRCTSPSPSVTCRIWPNGWWCHAVRPPGAKCTLSIRTRDGGPGVAISSIHTWPVNQSRGPGLVSARFLRISIGSAGSLGLAPWLPVHSPGSPASRVARSVLRPHRRSATRERSASVSAAIRQRTVVRVIGEERGFGEDSVHYSLTFNLNSIEVVSYADYSLIYLIDA